MRYSKLIVLSLVILAGSVQGFAQKIDPFSLLGDWQGKKGSQNIEFNFMDTNQVTMTSEFMEKITCPFEIRNIRGQNILMIRINPNTEDLKIYLWMNDADEIKLLSVDAINYKDPMKDPPTGKEPGCIIMKKQKSTVSG